MTEDDRKPTRRSVLRTGTAVAGALAVGGAAAIGSAAGRRAATAATSGKRGGRAQIDGEVRRHEPFTVTLDGTDARTASCVSGNSATQTYLTYSSEYCGSSDDESDGTLHVIPDEAGFVGDETYVVRAVRPYRTSDLDRVAFGPANEEC